MNYRRTVWLVLSLLAASACTDTESRTQVMLEIDADQAVRAELATLRVLISVSDDEGKTWSPRLTETFDEERVGGWDEFEWPARLGLVPDGDNFERRFNVRVQALDSGEDLYVWQSAVAGFTKGHTTVLRVSLSAECAAMLSSCGDPNCVGTKGCQTCSEGQCDEVEFVTLKEFDPDAEPGDAGGDVDGDAGDAGTRGDADIVGKDGGDDDEGGVKPPRDAGPDSGQDTGPGEEPEPPQYHVVSSTPDEDDPELGDDDDVVQVKLSAEVDAESVSWESFIVTRNGESLDGEFTVGKTTVSFDPDEPWVLGGRYHLELTDAIEDADGNPLDPFELDFRFHDGTWSRDQRATNVYTATIAAAPNGDAVLAVTRMGNSLVDIFARRFLAPDTWEGELPVITDSTLTALAISNKHHPFIAGNTLSANYQGNTYLEGPSWQATGYITLGGSDPGWCLDPDTDELHVVASVLGNDGNLVLRGLEYTLGEVSPAPTVTIGDDVVENRSPRVTLLDGDPIVVWRRQDNGSSPSRIVAGPFGVMLPETLSDVSGDALAPELVSNQAETSAIAIWEQADMVWNNVWVSRIAAGGNWSDAVRISDNLSSAQSPQLAMDDEGRALAVWRQDGVIMAAAYEPGDDWSEPIPISDDVDSMTLPRVALEPGGNGFAAWIQDGPVDMINEVWVARYLAGKGWQTPERVSATDAGTTEDVSLAIDNRGRAFVAWVEGNNGWVGRFE